jgi:hypothetical protein
MDKKSIITKIKEIFTSAENETEVPMNFLDVKTQDGRILRVSDVKLEGSVMEITEAGEVEIEDGTYILEDGISLVVEAGMIKEIIEASIEEVEEVMETEEVTESFMEVKLKDGTVLTITPTVEGEISKGDLVKIGEDMAPVGEHELEDGKILVIEEAGYVSELKEMTEDVSEDMEDVATEEKEMTGVVNNLKNLISEIKDLKSKFEALESENTELKARVETFAKSPSEEKTKTKVDFKGVDKAAKLNFFSKR